MIMWDKINDNHVPKQTTSTLRQYGTERLFWEKEYFLNRVAMEMYNLEINIQKMEEKTPVFLYTSLIWRIFG